MSRNCYLCGNTEESLFEVTPSKLRYGEEKDIVRCRSCGLVFFHPPMTPEEEKHFYEEEYGEIFSKEKDATPEDLFQQRLPEAQDYYSLVKDHLLPTDDCLELGCASGYFLHFIREKVGSVTGYEPFLPFQKMLADLNIPMIENPDTVENERFDRIFMFFLLEHLTQPIPYLENVRRILRPGGSLFVIVPNLEDALLSLYKIEGFRKFYFTLAHPYYYSKETLGRLLTKAGFPDHEILPHQRYDLSNHIHWMLTGRPGGQGRFNDLFSKALNQEYARVLKERFLCDTLFAVAQKGATA